MLLFDFKYPMQTHVTKLSFVIVKAIMNILVLALVCQRKVSAGTVLRGYSYRSAQPPRRSCWSQLRSSSATDDRYLK